MLAETLTYAVFVSRPGPGTVSSVRAGALVRVESRDGEMWSGKATHVSDRNIGLRGWEALSRTFREREAVTLLLDSDGQLVSCNARILSASGTLMRVVRRDDSVDSDRRRAPRLRVALDADLVIDDGTNEHLSGVEVVDLSALGCAIRSDREFRVGTGVRVALRLGTEEPTFVGAVVRTWVDRETVEPHAGIQFDTVDAAQTQLLNRFLLSQLQAGLEPVLR
jgi:hypothetical protein